MGVFGLMLQFSEKWVKIETIIHSEWMKSWEVTSCRAEWWMEVGGVICDLGELSATYTLLYFTASHCTHIWVIRCFSCQVCLYWKLLWPVFKIELILGQYACFFTMGLSVPPPSCLSSPCGFQIWIFHILSPVSLWYSYHLSKAKH